MNKIVFPLQAHGEGAPVVDLQDALRLLVNRRVLLVNVNAEQVTAIVGRLEHERAQRIYDKATAELVGAFQKLQGLHVTAAVDEPTAKALNELLLNLPAGPHGVTKHVIEGRVMLQHGLPAKKLKLRLYRLNFGSEATRVDEAITLEEGQYSLGYEPDGKAVSLEVRAVGDTDKEIRLCKPLSDLGTEVRVLLNLIAPSELQPAAAEYRRLSGDLIQHVGQMSKLAGAQENKERQDITLMNRATGWDARLIVMAVTAERLSADREVQLPREPVYGLLRAGLPSDKLMLAQLEPDTVEQALRKVRDAGVVELSDQQIGEFKTQFSSFAHQARLNVAAPGSHSTYGALLKASGLADEVLARFAPVYLNHRGDASALWDEARKAGLDETQVGRLQLQGKLAFLAANSEAMTARLMKKIDDPVQLVAQDFHRADAWVAEVLEQADIPLERRNALTDPDRVKLGTLVPPSYFAEKMEDRLAAYAEDMARKVRLSYPTQVVGRLLEQKEIALPVAHEATVKLMKQATARGFRLGETPLDVFLESHTGAQGDLSDADFESARQQMKTLQRVYQITPGNEAMPVLIGLGMNSAYDVTAYSEAEFVALYVAKHEEIYK